MSIEVTSEVPKILKKCIEGHNSGLVGGHSNNIKARALKLPEH